MLDIRDAEVSVFTTSGFILFLFLVLFAHFRSGYGDSVSEMLGEISAFAQFIQSRSESGSELFRRAPTPVVQEDNHWSDFDHVMMYRDHVKTVLAERFQNRCYFAFEHGHVACNRGILLRAGKRSPGV